jgi:hypothetical protein
MKEKLFIALLCLILVLPLCMAGAQENGAAVTPEQVSQITDSAVGLIDKAIAFISRIGAVFGDTLGIRLGGTTGMAIILLGAVILFGKRMPSLLKLLFIIIGIAMLAGGAANVVQIIRRILGQ